MTDPEQDARHGGDQWIVGIQDGNAIARHGLDDDLLHVGELLDAGDAAQAEVVAGDVEHDRHVVPLVAEALAQDPATRHLEHGEVHRRVLEHHGGGLRPGRIGLAHDPAVDVDPVGAGQADLAAHPLHDVRDHPGGRRLPVAAGDGHDRDARIRAGREEHVDHRLGDVLGLALGGVRVHAEAWCGVDLHDPAAGLPHRHADVGADQVDAGDVEADDLRGQLGELDVVGVRLLGPVDADPAGAHVAGALEVDARAARRHVGQLEALLARVPDRLLVELDAGQHLLVADPSSWIGIGDLDQLRQRMLAVALDVCGNALRDGAQDAVDDQASIVVADQVRLHDHRAAPALGACGSEAGTHRLLVVEVEHDAAPVVAVERLDRHGHADVRGGGHGGILVADQLGPGDRHAR